MAASQHYRAISTLTHPGEGRTSEKLLDYSPGVCLSRVLLAPLLTTVADNDVLTRTDVAIAAYEDARKPRKLVIRSGRHLDAHVNGFALSSRNAATWFRRWLMP